MTKFFLYGKTSYAGAVGPPAYLATAFGGGAVGPPTRFAATFGRGKGKISTLSFDLSMARSVT